MSDHHVIRENVFLFLGCFIGTFIPGSTSNEPNTYD